MDGRPGVNFRRKPEVKIVSDKVELIQTATLLGKQIDVYGSAENRCSWLEM